MLLLIDNYDSFVHNLARHFRRLGQVTVVMRNDAMDWHGIRAMRPDAVVISPGPCTPNEARCSLDVVRHLVDEVPILGVCLGHQVIAAALGGKIVRAAEPMHGRTSEIRHSGKSLFARLPSPMIVCRYHSLIVDESTLPAELEVTARTADGTIMAIAHRGQPVVGVQFHPEAILTEHGYALLAAFLRLAKLNVPEVLPAMESERDSLVTDADDGDWPLPFGGVATQADRP